MVKNNFNDIDFSGLKLASSKLSKSLQNTSESAKPCLLVEDRAFFIFLNKKEPLD
ncbi:hypothetical protein [Rummeliibacillus stabekisii]|uniref:hypothetical protein n=1 Tax=Rummeliibacillus stabekisii TaxID=241244 RepID=UPI00131437FF|nr:hypothetical protein [Rummeliibacillus stabekisii]